MSIKTLERESAIDPSKVDGFIDASQLVATAITADKITAGAVTASKIPLRVSHAWWVTPVLRVLPLLLFVGVSQERLMGWSLWLLRKGVRVEVGE
jgi:hypothetical protein